MRAAGLRREVWRDVRTGTARTALWVAALCLVVVGLATVEVAAVRQAVAAAHTYRDSGAATVTLSAPGRIDAPACAGLGSVDGVTAAGALRARAVPLRPAALPRGSVPVVEVTPGLLAVIGAGTTSASGVVLSAEAADVLAARPGSVVAVTDGGSVVVTGTYEWPSDGRRPGYGYAALAPVPVTGAFDECWLTAWPVPTDVASVLRTTLLPGDDAEAPVVLSQLNTTLGTQFTGGVAFDERLTRFAPVAGAALALALGFLSVRTRRAQLAALLHDGLSRASLGALVALETLAWLVPAALLAVCWTVVVAGTGPVDAVESTGLLAARVAVPALTAASVGAGAALTLTRERHLLRYVKDR